LMVGLGVGVMATNGKAATSPANARVEYPLALSIFR
jgi:hypothetical protein